MEPLRIAGRLRPRAPVRFILIGFYGWLVLGLALCGFVWLVGDRGAERWDPGAWIRLTGVSHLPILVLAFVIQFAATLLQVFGVGRVMAIVVFVF